MPTRFKNGLNNVSPTSDMADLIVLDPTTVHQYFDDFDAYVAANWVVTETQAGATQALDDADGGVLLLTNSSDDDDLVALQKVGESFLMESGKKAFFKARFKVSDATQSDVVIGLQITDTTPLDITDGIFFQKDDGDANLDFYVEKNNTASSATAIATISDDTYLTVAFVYNGDDEIAYFVDNVRLGSLASTNLPDDEELTISFAIQNGEAVAKTMSVDYILSAKER